MKLVDLFNQRKKEVFFARQRADAKWNKTMTPVNQKDTCVKLHQVQEGRVGNHTEAYQSFNDMLKKFDKDDLDKLWSLVKERFSSTDPTDDKERTLWVELKRLFEPNTDDILWKLQRYMHDPLTLEVILIMWFVYHVSTGKSQVSEGGLEGIKGFYMVFSASST
ncbi:hypothetical protein Tco_0713585 [Tanacetum coccineum]